MTESLNSTICIEIFGKDSLVQIETSKTLKNVGLILYIFGIIFLLVTFLYVLVKRNKYDRLKKRSILLLFLNLLATFIYMIDSPLRLTIGIEHFNCAHFAIVMTFTIILIVVTNLVRLFRLYHRVIYSKLLLDTAFATFQKQEQISSKTNETTSTIFLTKTKSFTEKYFSSILYFISCWSTPEQLEVELKYSYFLTTTNYTTLLFIFLFLSTILPTLSLIYYLFGDGFECVGCLTNFASTVFLPVSVIGILVGIYILCKTYYFPDILGIKKELFVTLIVLVVSHFFITTPIRFIFPQIEQENYFDLTLISLSSLFFLAFYSTFYQVKLAQNDEKLVNCTENEFLNIIKSTPGRKAFAVYLTYTFAVENLLFYEEVKKWRTRYKIENETKIIQSAKKICDLFVIPGSGYEINVGYYERKAVLDAVVGDNIIELKDDIFDICYQEVEKILFQQYNGFKLSKLYQVYKSNLGEIAGLKDLEA